MMGEIFIINPDHFMVLETQDDGVTGHYVRLQAPEKLREALLHQWVAASESTEELEFRTWTAVVKSIYNHHYRLFTEKPGDRDRIYHTLKRFPDEIRIRIEDYWARHGRLSKLLI
ncbi:MAG: hypothetical protein CL914_14770 [Deltaproteobacteria bacterium]|jgi:hypothetical protein|nr:hypothetical protein [Deltaproteobacteria bacterium]|tara:strand:- start:385 stop:729 length:345 start_codon:yes stop_codon:yes gene_type:complete